MVVRVSRAASTLLLACAIAAALASGCARQTPLAEVGAEGVEVWVRLTTTGGEKVTATLVSLDAGSIVVETRHRLQGDVRVRERGGEPALYNGVDRMPGDLVRVDTSDGARYAVVHRAFRALEVESATFHDSRGQRSLAGILSHLIGPVVGGALAAIL